MPQVTVYIRDEDIATWKSIEKKSAFLHDAILKHHLGDKIGIKTDYGKTVDVTPQTIDKKIESSEFVPKQPDPETGYPCCEKKTPCKHWHWDSDLTVWVNELTGKTKEG